MLGLHCRGRLQLANAVDGVLTHFLQGAGCATGCFGNALQGLRRLLGITHSDIGDFARHVGIFAQRFFVAAPSGRPFGCSPITAFVASELASPPASLPPRRPCRVPHVLAALASLADLSAFCRRIRRTACTEGRRQHCRARSSGLITARSAKRRYRWHCAKGRQAPGRSVRTRTKQKGPLTGPLFCDRRCCLFDAWFLYSSVRVSISILSPISTKAGTRKLETGRDPGRLHDLARGRLDGGFGIDEISRTTLLGSSTEIALPL